MGSVVSFGNEGRFSCLLCGGGGGLLENSFKKGLIMTYVLPTTFNNISHDLISKPILKMGNRFVGDNFAVIRTCFHVPISQIITRTC